MHVNVRPQFGSFVFLRVDVRAYNRYSYVNSLIDLLLSNTAKCNPPELIVKCTLMIHERDCADCLQVDYSAKWAGLLTYYNELLFTKSVYTKNGEGEQ